MRKHSQLVVYHSILPVLHQPGCPFCRLLKDFQADRLQKHAQGEMHHLCNFHIWGLAAVKDAPDAAKIFLDLVNEAAPSSAGAASCDLPRTWKVRQIAQSGPLPGGRPQPGQAWSR